MRILKRKSSFILPTPSSHLCRGEVLAGIQDAQRKLTAENPDRVVTVGGNCMVSLALFDYLHGKYENVGIVWIYAHPDVSTLNDGYPNAHAYGTWQPFGTGCTGNSFRRMRQSGV